MSGSGISSEALLWALFLVIAFPAVTLALGEMIMRLRRQNRPVASPLSAVRNLVLPALALMLVLTKVAGFHGALTTVKLLQTLLWLFIIHTSLSFFNVALFAGAKEGTWQSNAPKLFIDLARLLLVLICAAILLSTVWNQDLTRVVAALGVGSIVIGLALQDPVGNLFSGIVLMLERPLKVGDYVKIGDSTGEVLETNWRSVHVVVRNRGLLIVPNGMLAKSSFSNYSRPVKVFAESLVLGFSVNDPPNKVKRILKETALRTPLVASDPAPSVRLHAYAASSIEYRVTLRVTDDWNKLRYAVDEFKTLVWYAAKRYGLSMPFPAQTTIMVDKKELEAETQGPMPADALQAFPRFSLSNGSLNGSEIQNSEVKHYAKGEKVVVEGGHLPGIHLILKGKVLLTAKDGTGAELEIARLERGEFFGEKAVLASEASDVTVTALDDLELLLLDTDALHAMLDRLPQLSREIGNVMETRRRALQGARANKNAQRNRAATSS
jgi:small-conductance mechanosensitive channel